MERRSTDLEEMRKKTQGCWIVVKHRGQGGQSIGNVTKAHRTRRTSLGKMRN